MLKPILVLSGCIFVFMAAGYQTVDSKIDGGAAFTCDTQKLHFKSCTSEVPGCTLALYYCLTGAAPDRTKLCTETGGERACQASRKPYLDCIGGPNHDVLSDSSCDTPTAGTTIGLGTTTGLIP